MRGKIFLFLALLLVAMGVAGLAYLVPFTTNSTVAGYEYRVSTLRANWYLMANGYSKRYDGVKISLVDEVQAANWVLLSWRSCRKVHFAFAECTSKSATR